MEEDNSTPCLRSIEQINAQRYALNQWRKTKVCAGIDEFLANPSVEKQQEILANSRILEILLSTLNTMILRHAVQYGK